MKFVEFYTDSQDKEPILINIEHITDIFPSSETMWTDIELDNREVITVHETYTTVVNILENKYV